MTVKVTLSIPDDLGVQIDKYRDRINQSAIFAEAIRKEIAMMDLKTDLGDLGAAIDRLRPDREAYEKQHGQLGYAAAVEWATKKARYAELKEAAKWNGNQATDYADDKNAFFSTHAGIAQYKAQAANPGPFNDKGFILGWFNGCKAVWDALSDKI